MTYFSQILVLTLICILFLFAAIQFILLIWNGLKASHKYFLLQPLDLSKRYGPKTWVIITGPSSGMGYALAKRFAKQGFNLFLIGSVRSFRLIDELKKEHPHIQVCLVVKDFGQAFEADFFDSIEQTLNVVQNEGGEISILVNSVGHRVAWKGYHTMPAEHIRDTISCGTYVQARLTQIALNRMLQRPQTNNNYKSAIITISALCIHPTFWFGSYLSNELSVPYLSVYEASNAFGFYHANSVAKEYTLNPLYKNRFDFLNITPGSVLTDSTRDMLQHTPLSVECDEFVDSIMTLIGNVQGTTCAHYKHALASILMNFAPWLKEKTLTKTGEKIADLYMKDHGHHHDKYKIT